MKRTKLTAMLACSVMLLASTANATKYDLPSGKIHHFHGPSFYGVHNLECSVRTELPGSHTIVFESLKNRSYVNGVILTKGNKASFTVQQNSVIKFEVERGAKLSVLNTGEGLVNVKCD